MGKPRFYWNGATILTEVISAVEAWKVRIAMFLRHDPSSLCNTTGALLVKVDLSSNFALPYGGALRQSA
ncbi:hypothetical protein EFR84_26660 [Rhizobium chutanense]|uniref:Uncharacterized protein n=1 Tax=Rhizobium chutanense TaxID=2035448 RepID=A0A3S0SKR1_9HYPH|nr:hypothetical protein EFR84_26660 [Rhizobium chutanense]